LTRGRSNAATTLEQRCENIRRENVFHDRSVHGHEDWKKIKRRRETTTLLRSALAPACALLSGLLSAKARLAIGVMVTFAAKRRNYCINGRDDPRKWNRALDASTAIGKRAVLELTRCRRA